MSTTGWHQAAAGAGQHRTERQARGQAVRIGHQMNALPAVQLPLNLDATGAFIDEWRRDNAPHVNVAERAIIGGVLGYALQRSIQARRGR